MTPSTGHANGSVSVRQRRNQLASSAPVDHKTDGALTLEMLLTWQMQPLRGINTRPPRSSPLDCLRFTLGRA